MMDKKIRKVIIPVAGYGTRFLPYTKSIPKEMLPIVDKPIVHHIAEEAAEAGIEDIILITGYNKRAIEDYFDYNLELEILLEKKGKHSELGMSRHASDLAQFIYIRQKEQRGNGHAILQAKDLIAPDEPFVVMWGDEMYKGQPSKLQQMIKIYEEHQKPVFLTMHTETDGDRYGYVNIGEEQGDRLWKVDGLVEKPGNDNIPHGAQAALGCYIVTGHIFEYLQTQDVGVGGEIVFADALSRYAKDHEVLAHEMRGIKYFDCGNKLEYMKAVVEYGLDRDDIGNDFRDYLRELSNNL